MCMLLHYRGNVITLSGMNTLLHYQSNIITIQAASVLQYHMMLLHYQVVITVSCVLIQFQAGVSLTGDYNIISFIMYSGRHEP